VNDERSNAEWIEALFGEPDQKALADLRARLLRGMGYALKQRYRVTDADLEDFVQDALVRILANLASFRGESRFTTWAQKIAVRIAFSELRRKRWEEVSLHELGTVDEESDAEASALAWMPSPVQSPEQQVTRQSLVTLLSTLIQEELTDRQRQAMMTIVLKGMPLEEVALRMGTNRNALYKLLHDARQRLKRRLEVQGVTVSDVMSAFESSG